MTNHRVGRQLVFEKARCPYEHGVSACVPRQQCFEHPLLLAIAQSDAFRYQTVPQ